LYQKHLLQKNLSGFKNAKNKQMLPETKVLKVTFERSLNKIEAKDFESLNRKVKHKDVCLKSFILLHCFNVFYSFNLFYVQMFVVNPWCNYIS